jgi:hypothetical protein
MYAKPSRHEASNATVIIRSKKDTNSVKILFEILDTATLIGDLINNAESQRNSQTI